MSAIIAPGGLTLCLNDEEREQQELSIRRMHNQPGVGANDRRMIDGDEARRMEPGVGPEVVAATHCPHDGIVNPLHVLHALHRILHAAGVDYRPDHRVDRIEPDGEGFCAYTRNGPVRAARVVIAAGNGSRRLGRDLGLDIPVSPERGHIMVTERTGPMFNLILNEIRQTDEGTVMLGASAERVGFDTGFNPSMIGQIAARAIRKVPGLGKLRIIRSWTALRIMPPDGFPIYAESEVYPGAFAVTCHSGVTLAAAHACRLAPALLDGTFNDTFAAFSPRRFDVSAT